MMSHVTYYCQYIFEIVPRIIRCKYRGFSRANIFSRQYAARKEFDVIRTVIYLTPKNGNTQALIDYFHNDKVLEHSAEIDGFIDAELFCPTVGNQIMVTATWDSEAAYQRWIDDPWRAASNERISKLLEEVVGSETRGASFESIHRVTKNHGVKLT